VIFGFKVLLYLALLMNMNFAKLVGSEETVNMCLHGVHWMICGVVAFVSARSFVYCTQDCIETWP